MYVVMQAMLFYSPRWLWKNWETGKISSLTMDLDQGIITWVLCTLASLSHGHWTQLKCSLL